MALGLLSFCIVFLSIASGGLLLTRQDVMARQVSTLNSTFRRKKKSVWHDASGRPILLGLS